MKITKTDDGNVTVDIDTLEISGELCAEDIERIARAIYDMYLKYKEAK